MSANDAAPDRVSLTPADRLAVACSELRGSVLWFALGVAVLFASVRMDRLEQQHINPYTIPGLLPGLLGIVMMLLGGLLAVRSWHNGARLAALVPRLEGGPETRRIALVIVLVVVYSVVLVGHGLPFWLVSAVYVTVSILLLQRPQRRAAGRTLDMSDVVFALAVGLGSGVAITIVFQYFFLVRLP